MTQKHRISTNIGKDQKVVVELKQDFDLLEILSLKFSQKEIYASLCSDYGVVCGRISANNGFGVPNAKISIFIPLDVEDEEDPVLSKLYPYKTIVDRNEDGYRYNLLPSRQQHSGHEPTGTFPDQIDVLGREEVLEVFEKYYKYTAKTNQSGDFMIWGVPVGSQDIHVDIDLSDIGCFSLRPYDFIKRGVGVSEFKSESKFESSEDIDKLPQIISFDKTIEVFPFWGNMDLCEIGITRTDFDLSQQGISIEPKAYLIGGLYSDTDKNSLNKNCYPRKKMGRKCDLQTKSGKVESIRFTTFKDENNRPILDVYNINDEIPEDGGFMIEIPMNMEYIYTNEFGENVLTNDTKKGIPTASCYRFRFSLDDMGNDRTRKTASYLVPNIREYAVEQDKSYAFSLDWNDYPSFAVSEDDERGILYNENGRHIPRDYFYRMTYNKVYTVSSFHSLYYHERDNGMFLKNRFLGIKEIVPSEEEDCSDILTPPTNFGTKNYTFNLLIAEILLSFEQLSNLVLLTSMNTLIRILFGFSRIIGGIPLLKSAGVSLAKFTYELQSSAQRELYLINYPECEECSVDEEGNVDEFGQPPSEQTLLGYCQVGAANIETTNQYNYDNGQAADVLSISYEDSSSVSQCTYNSSAQPITGGTINDQNQYFVDNQSDYLLITPDNKTITLGGEFKFVLDLNNLIFYNDSGNSFDELGFGDGVYKIVDKVTTDTGVVTSPPSGCELYNVPYDEELITYYYVGPSKTKVSPPPYITSSDIYSTNLSNDDGVLRIGNRVPIYYYQDRDSGRDIYPLLPSWEGQPHDMKTHSGQSEFIKGVFVIVPGAQTNLRVWGILREYTRRKRVNMLFCGGIVNYSFIDNWMSGSLYFPQFKAKIKSKKSGIKEKYCEDVVRYISEDNRFYYRSARYIEYNFDGDDIVQWGYTRNSMGQLASVGLGRPTTMVDLGPRDEFIKEICVDPELDPNCSVSRSVGQTSFKSFGDIMGLAINYRMDVSDNQFGINRFFDNTGFRFTHQVLDGDILQIISMNNEAGIEEFDLEESRYMGYNYGVMDPDQNHDVFRPNGYWGPLPITLFLDEDGERTRLCLNEPGRLTNSSQIVPFFLWDKKGVGFGGTSEQTSDKQSWDYESVVTAPLQGMAHGYRFSPAPDSHQYLLLPITQDYAGKTFTGSTGVIFDFDAVVVDVSGLSDYEEKYPGFTVLVANDVDNPTTGTIYTRVGGSGWSTLVWDQTKEFILRPTTDHDLHNKRILSTPFLFYFGLKSGRTGLDKFIKYFGDKGDFVIEE
jgi:hypothetical protein